MEKLRQPIELHFVEPKSPPKGLADTLKLLKEIESHISKLSAGPNISPKFNQSVEEINKAFLKRKEGMRPYEFGSLAKSLGLDDKEIGQVKAQLLKLDNATKGKHGFNSKKMQFSGTLQHAAEAFRVAMDKSIADTEKNFSRLFNGVGGGSAKAGGIKVEGKIDVLIPAAQFQASVIGSIPINIPASQFTAGGGRDPATGQFLPGGGGATGGGAGKKEKSKVELQPAPKGVPKSVPDEIARTVTQTTKGATEAITTLLDGGKTLTKTFDDVGEQIKIVTKNAKLQSIGKKLSTDLANLKRQATADMLNVKTGDKVKDLMAVAKIKDQLADDIQKSFKSQEANLPAPARDTLKKVYTTQANVISAQAREAQRLAGVETQNIAAAAAAEAKKLSEKAAANQKAEIDEANAKRQQEAKGGSRDVMQQHKSDVARVKRQKLDEWNEKMRLADVDDAAARELRRIVADNSAVLTKRQRSGMRRAAYELEEKATNARLNSAPPPRPPAPAPPPRPPAPAPPPGLTERLGLNARLSAVDFAKNTIKVGAWGMAVAAAAAPVALATYSLQRMIEVGSQTARLEQVFRGVGGTARELALDVIKLASANGRSTDEAMSSAIAWSRLGLSRVQVNEAVRVSLMASNVAELSAADATEHLSSLMIVYGMRVGELDGALGQLNATSNRWNVTNSDLLQGLSRSAAVAKQAGISFSELQGLIGATVGRTSQSGSQIGNAIKTILTRLGRGDVQDTLRSLGVESTSATGAQKNKSQLLKEMVIRYGELNQAEQLEMARVVAGATQINRFTGLMESYVDAQKLAVDAQLNLNSALIENEKIVGTLKSKWAGLIAEVDRYAVQTGDGFIKPAVHFGKNLLRDINDFDAPDEREMTMIAARTQKKQEARERFRNRLDEMEAAGKTVPKGVDFFDPRGRRAAFLDGLPSLDAEDELAAFHAQTSAQRAAGRANKNIDKAAKRVSGFSDKAQTMDMVASIISGKGSQEWKDANARSIADWFGSKSEEFTAAVSGGDTKKAMQFLTQGKSDAAEESKLAVQEELALRAERLNALTQERVNLEAELKTVTASADKNPERQSERSLATILTLESKIKEIKKEQLELRNKAKDYNEVDAGDTEDELIRQEKNLGMINARANMQQAIESRFNLDQPVTGVGKLDRKAEMLKAQIALLEKERADISAVPEGSRSPEQKAMLKRIREDLKDRNANLIGVSSPEYRSMVGVNDLREVASKRTVEDVANMGVGTSSAERLLNQEKGIQEELVRLKKRQVDWSLTAAQHEADNARALVLQNQLLNTREAIQKRIRDLAAEEKQARLEGQREFNRSLLMSGPGELLRKFAANQLNSRGPMGVGQFMAMSPEMRGDVDMMNGGERMRSIREEKNRLNSLPQLTPEQYGSMTQEQLRDYRNRMRQGRPMLSPKREAAERANGLDMKFQSQYPASGALDTAKTNAELNNVAIAAQNVNGGFGFLLEGITQLRNSFSNLVTWVAEQTGKGSGGGLNTGHALGASN